jgi:hypothetical protein
MPHLTNSNSIDYLANQTAAAHPIVDPTTNFVVALTLVAMAALSNLAFVPTVALSMLEAATKVEQPNLVSATIAACSTLDSVVSLALDRANAGSMLVVATLDSKRAVVVAAVVLVVVVA